MNLIEFIQAILETTTPFVLLALIYASYRAISPHRIQEEEISNIYSFKKGRTEYIYPPRPLSTTFYDFLQLSLMPTPNLQKQLAHTFSRLIKEQHDIDLLTSKSKYTSSLKRLIEDPDAWLREISNQPTKPGIFRNQPISEILYEEFVNILAEIQEICGIPLLLESE